MAIHSTDTVAVFRGGSGDSQSFAIDFPVDSVSDLVVSFLDSAGNAAEKRIDADYQIQIIRDVRGFPISAAVSLVDPLPAGWTLTIERHVQITQLTRLENQGGYFPADMERALDKLTMIAQELGEQIKDASENADPAVLATIEKRIAEMDGRKANKDDTRFADARTPKAHAASHAAGGSDPITPASIGTLPLPPDDGNRYLATAGGYVRYIESQGGGGAIATTETAGIVKPDGATIRVEKDGGISVPDATITKSGLMAAADKQRIDQARITVSASSIDFHVSPIGDDSNTGLSQDSPVKTFSRLNSILRKYDFAGSVVNVNLSSGVYSQSFLININNILNATSFHVKGTGYDTTVFDGLDNVPYAFNIQGMLLTPCYIDKIGINKFVNAGILARSSAFWINDIDFGQMSTRTYTYHMLTQEGSTAWTSGKNYRISGSASFHIQVTLQSQAYLVRNTVTITNTPNFSHAYVAVDACSIGRFGGAQFKGGATGRRFIVRTNSVIETNGGGVNFFPGSIAGNAEASTGGFYV